MNRFLLRSAASAVIVAGIVLPALAADSMASSSAAMTKHVKVTIDGACMATAVSARDTAIGAALGTVVTALNTRGAALSAAWGNTDPKARKAAVKAANAAFAGTWKTFNTARKAAWTTYGTAAKACHGTAADMDTPNTSAAGL